MYSRAPAPIVQHGLQGREIWSLDLHRLSDGLVLCATAAEDTTVKISIVFPNTSSTKSIGSEVLYTWSDGDGALQNIRWSSSAADADGALLFVTAAKESLYALSVSAETKGGHPRLKVKSAGRAARAANRNDDSRIMALDVVRHEDKHILLAGYSDGTLRWWRYQEDRAQFMQLGSTNWHDRCLLSAKLLICREKHRLYAATGATDGRCAILDLRSSADTEHGSQGRPLVARLD